MELTAWDKFSKSGKIEDYLEYCESRVEKTGEYNRESAGDSDRYCAVSDSDRGVSSAAL